MAEPTSHIPVRKAYVSVLHYLFSLVLDVVGSGRLIDASNLIRLSDQPQPNHVGVLSVSPFHFTILPVAAFKIPSHCPLFLLLNYWQFRCFGRVHLCIAEHDWTESNGTFIRH